MIGISGSHAESAGNTTLDAMVLHGSGDGVDAAFEAFFQQIPVDVGRSVPAARLDVRQPDGGDDLRAVSG